MIAICDYGMGNLRSVEKAFEHAGAPVLRTAEPDALAAAAGLVLPGVGAFPAAMERLRALGLDALVRERAAAGVPVLGICLGMQLLFSSAEEGGGAEGLGLVEGRVERIEAPGLKVPHIGWTPVAWRKPSALTDGLADGEPFYFVHSYAPRPRDPGDVLGVASHGEELVCAVERDNVCGVQFHPEKSSRAGLRLLGNFAARCARVPA